MNTSSCEYLKTLGMCDNIDEANLYSISWKPHSANFTYLMQRLRNVILGKISG